jgi:hypothetical protein
MGAEPEASAIGREIMACICGVRDGGAAVASDSMLWLPWTDAAAAAAGAGAATKAMVTGTRRVWRAASAWTRELTVMLALYALWQLAGDLSLGGEAGALQRGREIYRAEHSLHLPSERSVQSFLLGNHDLLRVLNLYYVGLHVAVMGACLVWVFARHRDRYPVVRNTLALATGASLLVSLEPVAPPRLVPGLGLVDTGRLVGPTVYPATARPGLDQLSAMPSVHVAWALVVAATVVYLLRSRWRWVAFLYPVFTTVVVVVTGNHYWADGAVAVVIVAASAFVALRVAGSRRRSEVEDDLAEHGPVAEQAERLPDVGERDLAVHDDLESASSQRL